MIQNTQKELELMRKPRVHITYDLQVGERYEKKELPLVAGVIADLTGNGGKEQPVFKDRKFIEIDRENFDKVMSDMSPGVKMTVADKVKGEGSMEVQLSIKKFDDFNPGKLIDQVEPLKNLMAVRKNLLDLIAKLDGNDKLQDMLLESLRSPEKIKQLTAG